MQKGIILIPTKIEAALIEQNKSIIVSGIGKKTIKTLKNIIEEKKPTKAILVGFAGRLNDELRMNCTYNVINVTNGVHHLELSALNKDWQNVSLITVTDPVYTIKRRLELSKHADLVDMEGYYFTEFCLTNSITPYIIRITSDNCDKKITDFFFSGTFMEAKTELAKTVRTIEPLLSL